PFVLLLLDYWPLGRFENMATFYQRVREKIPLFILAGASCAITFFVQQSSGVMEFGKGVALNWRIANAFVAYTGYIGKMFYPVRLAVLYPHPENTLPMWQLIVSLVILVAISAAVIYTSRKRKYLAVGWFWYLGTLVPVIGLVQVGPQAMADRYTYIPLIGIFIMIAWGAAELFAKWRYRKIILGTIATLLLVSMLICTRMQVRYWRNSSNLFERALEVNQNNPIIHNNMGVLLISQDKLDMAANHLQRALQAKPDYINAHYNLGNVFQLQGKLDDAISHYRRALKIYPENADVHNNLGSALQSQERFDEAISHYIQSLRIRPGDHRVESNLDMAMSLRNKSGKQK
ncbi:MAG: tetratricopeptide repeat protein, partial [Planctomycetes bacterium]|nr:tetratricopeptide repeat protein [Planctomycetota bacterium]